MEKIAAYITAYNEEQRIARIIRSVSKFDYILVIDKSSTDRTKEIAEGLGAKVVTVPYTDNDPEYNFNIMRETLLENDIHWGLNVVCSDICHADLYGAIYEAVNSYAKDCDSVNIPFIQYSMGLSGKNTFYNKSKTKPLLSKIESLKYDSAVHTFHLPQNAKIINLKVDDKKIGIYHLTHENLDIIMERHTRYAKNIATNRLKSGRTKERELRSCTVAVVRHVLDYFKLGVFKKKWDGLAQFFMLLMYYSMIYLFTYFDEDKSKQIMNQYKELAESLIGREDEHKEQIKED